MIVFQDFYHHHHIEYDLVCSVSVNVEHRLNSVQLIACQGKTLYVIADRLKLGILVLKMTDSITPDNDIISVWNKFPTTVRNDPCLSAFREEFEEDHGKSFGVLFGCMDFFTQNYRFF